MEALDRWASRRVVDLLSHCAETRSRVAQPGGLGPVPRWRCQAPLGSESGGRAEPSSLRCRLSLRRSVIRPSRLRIRPLRGESPLPMEPSFHSTCRHRTPVSRRHQAPPEARPPGATPATFLAWYTGLAFRRSIAGNERVRIEDRFGETRVPPLLPTTSGCLDGFLGPRWSEGSGSGLQTGLQVKQYNLGLVADS